MSASHLGHDSARSERLFNNAGLVVDRPPPTRAKAADKLNPPHRPAGLKRMVKSRHKTILHGPPDSTFTPRQRRWVRDHAYAARRRPDAPERLKPLTKVGAEAYHCTIQDENRSHADGRIEDSKREIQRSRHIMGAQRAEDARQDA